MADFLAIDWEDRHYEVDLTSVTAREFKAIKVHTGLKAGDFIKSFMSIDDMDADAVVALLWLAKSRADGTATFDDDLPIFQLLTAVSRPGVDAENDGTPDAGTADVPNSASSPAPS
jgi:hypothetical protein